MPCARCRSAAACFRRTSPSRAAPCLRMRCCWTPIRCSSFPAGWERTGPPSRSSPTVRWFIRRTPRDSTSPPSCSRRAGICSATAGRYAGAPPAPAEGSIGCRAGSPPELVSPDSSIVRLAPDLNAGTIALQYFFSGRILGREWAEAVSPDGLMATYWRLFGDPFGYFHPLYEIGLREPDLVLPLLPRHILAFNR